MSCLPYLCRIHTCFFGCKWTHTRFFTQKKTELHARFFMIQYIIFIIFSTAWEIQTNAFILCICAVYQIMVTRSKVTLSWPLTLNIIIAFTQKQFNFFYVHWVIFFFILCIKMENIWQKWSLDQLVVQKLILLQLSLGWHCNYLFFFQF